MEIAAAAFATLSDHRFLARLCQISDHVPGLQILDDRPLWHFDHIIFAIGSMHLLGLPVTAGLCLHLLVIAQVQQCRLSGVYPKDHTAAIAPIAAMGAAISNIFLAAERNDAIAALARLYMYFDSVDKHAFTSSKIKSP